MSETAINLEKLAYDGANFAHSDREPTSMDSFIEGERPFLYRWTGNDEMEILTFEDPTKPNTAKLFRYNREQIYSGVNLTNDVPLIVGGKVVEFLKEYAIKFHVSLSNPGV